MINVFLFCFVFFNVHYQSPRRNCCRVRDAKKKGTMVIDVGLCKEGDISEI